MERLKELYTTEKNYIESLTFLVKNYKDYMERSRNDPGLLQMPTELKEGKDHLVFGNVDEILKFHENQVLPYLERATKSPASLVALFATKKDDFKNLYGRFCSSKNKYSVIICEFKDYFNDLQKELATKLTIDNLMLTPVQRFPRYQLLIMDAQKAFSKSGAQEKAEILNKALDIVKEVCNYCNDMMDVSYITDYKENVFDQGQLKMKFDVSTLRKAKRYCMVYYVEKEPCALFVFQKSVILCQKVDLGETRTQFKCLLSFETSCLSVKSAKKSNDLILSQQSKNKNRYTRPGSFYGFGTLKLGANQGISMKSKSSILLRCPTDQIRNQGVEEIQAQIDAHDRLAAELANPGSPVAVRRTNFKRGSRFSRASLFMRN